MINLQAFTNFDGKKLTRITDKASLKALPKAAALIRAKAKQKVRRRKHKSSSPGMPPYAHSNVFKASILFGIDRQDMAAFIGPQRLTTSRTNYAGVPVPGILESGGMAALGMNANWIHKRAPRGLHNLRDIARYFQHLGKGPISWGSSPAQADAKAGGEEVVAASQRESTKSGKMKFKVHPKRFSPVMKRKVYLGYIKITTTRQAIKVAKTVVDVFGYPATNRPIPIAPRPFMGPSLDDSKSELAKFWANTM